MKGTCPGALSSEAAADAHDLRHTCATLLLAQGTSARVVMETLGHSQVTLTLDTYSHVLPSVQKEAAQRLDALLSA